jgi:DNA polymerase III subunit epsilon
MSYESEVLYQLLNITPRFTSDAPDNRRGIYVLIDHIGRLSYIGCTRSSEETLRKRIHLRHRTGSENSSHYFSTMYNTGRMWRDRVLQRGNPDADLAKSLRNAFIADHCRAVWVELADMDDIFGIERYAIANAPKSAIAWNGRSAARYNEPEALVDETIRRLKLEHKEIAALDRQKQLFMARKL